LRAVGIEGVDGPPETNKGSICANEKTAMGENRERMERVVN
jgi:hypothetical protein